MQRFVETSSELKFTKVEEISSHALLGKEPKYAESNAKAGNKDAHEYEENNDVSWHNRERLIRDYECNCYKKRVQRVSFKKRKLRTRCSRFMTNQSVRSSVSNLYSEISKAHEICEIGRDT